MNDSVDWTDMRVRPWQLTNLLDRPDDMLPVDRPSEQDLARDLRDARQERDDAKRAAAYAEERRQHWQHEAAKELERAEAADARYRDEHAIIDRIWRQLGVTSYAEARGLSIFELIAKLQTASTSADALSLLACVDDMLHDGDEHARWAHALVHQAAAHLSAEPEIREQAAREARAAGGYAFDVRQQ